MRSRRTLTVTLATLALLTLLVATVSMPIVANESGTIGQERDGTEGGENGTESSTDANVAEFALNVTADGTVDELEFVASYDEKTYSELELAASINGYESVADLIGSEFAADDPAVGNYTAEDRETDDGYESDVRLTDIDLDASENMSAAVDDGTIRWETTGVEGPDGNGMFDEVMYVVAMPGDVTDTNAIETSNGTAVWRIHEEYPGDLFAEAAINAVDAESDSGNESDGDGTADVDDEDDDGAGNESDDDDGETGDGLPGLGVGTALAGLLGALLIAARRVD